MDKHRKWQRFLIITVILLTFYNILPTVFFYSKPLTAPIDEPRAQRIAEQIVDRVNALEISSIEWLGSFCNLLGVKAKNIALDLTEPQIVQVEFSTLDDANTFRAYLQRAGALIPFIPSQLSLYDPENTTTPTVAVERKIPIHFAKSKLTKTTQFSEKFDAEGAPTALYRGLIEDRALQLGMALAGPSENAELIQSLGDHPGEELVSLLAQRIVAFAQAYGESSEITSRYFSTFTRLASADRSALFQKLVTSMQEAKTSIRKAKTEIEEQKADVIQQQKLEVLSSREHILSSALALVKRHPKAFTTGPAPTNFPSLEAALRASSTQKMQLISLEKANPFIESIAIDWKNDRMSLQLYPAVQETMKENSPATSQLLYNEIALVSRQIGETILPRFGQFEIPLSNLKNSKSFLALRLGDIAAAKAHSLEQALKATWHPSHPDLVPTAFPIHDYETYQKLPAEEREFGLIIYAPAQVKGSPLPGFRMQSIYVIAKGADQFIQRLKTEKNSEFSYKFNRDWNRLKEVLQSNGFLGYAASALPKEFSQEVIFECENYYQAVLKATREDFSVQGSKRFALLEFTNVEQRILTENKIDDRIHEDLLKSRDDYDAAHLGIRGVSKYDVPKPIDSVLWSNIKLSARKYVRGDEKKILRWGLDLSGGKTVQIELRDPAGKTVTDPLDIKQGVNELYNRVNKMGVSEVSIRQEGDFITLDFPGSQGLSASELVKASSMYFHIVNEQFGPGNSLLFATVDEFLQDVWNEAAITGKKSTEDINRIAYSHLYGEGTGPELVKPRTEAARALYQQGLRLADPQTLIPSGFFDNTYSSIRILRGEDFTDWQGQTHPLVIVFHNFALEGSSLENIHAGYDPSKGNFLSFGVEGSHTTKQGKKLSPSDDLFAWTSVYSKEKIAGTPLENYSHGRGWRMAVVLNERIVSSPALESALRDSGMITGSFTQREITQLETDLKAGSLSFTPHILSENNVSPELGSKERIYGIVATALSLLLVIGVMTFYYRFAGVVASVALLCNLLIMWATLQNLHATMTLAGLAGIILTLAMAVDANVLVFERIREEFAKTGRIATAIHAGYRKAFSAIIDANVTTIIGAMILLHFDSGPIKALAIMLIIGIISSLFTALFMTRFFFSGWAHNPKNQTLRMLNWFQSRGYNFLKHTRKTVIFSAIVILIGGFFLVKEKTTLFGMDFTGGYAATVQLSIKEGANYRTLVEEALLKQGVTSQDVQVRELTPSNTVRILLSRGLELPGRPFFDMPLENDLPEPFYPYERNPKLVWVVETLRGAGLEIDTPSLEQLDNHWTQVSGQMSEAMRTNASIGLFIALLCVLLYITVRFEFKYAISATLCLAHDLIFTLGLLAILHAIGLAVQIDLSTVAALLTIVGYSLNDTIIIFDRIREDVRLMHKASFSDIINHALNITLSRTMMTSGTTLLVLIPMILLGGSTLFGFSLVIAIGVIFGTLSSLFIAAPLMKYFHDREHRKEDGIREC